MRPIMRFATLPFGLFCVVARPAAASDPSSIWAVPTKVEMLPDEATATRVVIHGAFFFLQSVTPFSYGEPRCGVMHFQCPAGREQLCRMQWLDLRMGIGRASCQGFGTNFTVSSATLRTEGSALGTPDPWDLGMGIAQGFSVDQKCPKARMLVCAGGPPAVPGTPADAATPIPADAGATPADAVTSDMSVASVDAQATAVDAAVTTAADAPVSPPSADAAEPKLSSTSAGCAVAGTPGASGAWAGMAMLLALVLVRRGHRR